MSEFAKEVSMMNFEDVLDTNEMVLLDFWSNGCAPCKTFGPVFETMAEHNADIFFGKVNTEVARDLAEALQIRSVPTLMAFKKGELVYEQSGLLPPAQLEMLLDKLRALEVEPQPDLPEEEG